MDLGPRGGKWSGIVSCSGMLYCAPYDASAILVIDSETGAIKVIETGMLGIRKWSGIATCGGKLYCSPFDAPSVLVLDL